MHKWLVQSSLLQAADLVYPTTSHRCSSRCIFSDFPSLRGAPVQNRASPDMGDGPTGTEYIWKYLSGIMFWWCGNDLQSNYHHRAQNRFQSAAFAEHLLIGMIGFWSCPVHTSDADWSTFSFVG
jgi:hypothetical protein